MNEKNTPFPPGNLPQGTATNVPAPEPPLFRAIIAARFRSKSAQWVADRKKGFAINIKQPDNAFDRMIVSSMERRRELFNSITIGLDVGFWACLCLTFLGSIAGVTFYFLVSAWLGKIIICSCFIMGGLARCSAFAITNIDRIRDLSFVRWRKRSITAETANLPESVQVHMQEIVFFASMHGLEPCFILTELDHPFIRGNILSVFCGSEDYFIMA